MKRFVCCAVGVCAFAGAAAAGERPALSHTVVVPAPIGEVWEAFTTVEGMEGWMVEKAEIDLRPGGEMRTAYSEVVDLHGPEAIVNEILSYEPERMLSTRLKQKPAGFRLVVPEGAWTVVRFEPVGHDATRVTETGYGWPDDERYQQAYDFFDRGNEWTLDRLVEHFGGASELGGDAGRTMELARRWVGGEWIAEHPMPEGRTMRARTVAREGAGGSVLSDTWLGFGDGAMFHHGTTQVWTAPVSEGGGVWFQSIDEKGGVARGRLEAVGEEELLFHWDTVSPDGTARSFRVPVRFTGPDAYEMRVNPRAEDGTYPDVGEPIRFRRVESAPARFLPGATPGVAPEGGAGHASPGG